MACIYEYVNKYKICENEKIYKCKTYIVKSLYQAYSLPRYFYDFDDISDPLVTFFVMDQITAFDDYDIDYLQKTLDLIPSHFTGLGLSFRDTSIPIKINIPAHITYLKFVFNCSGNVGDIEKNTEHIFDNLPVSLNMLDLSYYFPIRNPPPSLTSMVIHHEIDDIEADDMFKSIPSLEHVFTFAGSKLRSR